MRIVVVSSTVFPVPPPGYSGLEQLAWQQARGLIDKGHSVTLVAPEGSTCEGATLVSTGPPGRWDERAAYGGYHYKTGRVVKDEKGNQAEEVVSVPGYWPRLLDADVVIDHGWQKWSYILKAEGRLKAPILGFTHAPVNTMFSSLPPGVDRPCFVCISHDQANHFNALFSPVSARVCHNGVDPEFYKPIEGVKRTSRFLFLARFSTIKGPDIAIEACKRSSKELDLVGDTTITGEPEYFQHCASRCDATSVRMLGPATRGECVRHFTRSFALLHPNLRFREPFGLAPVEAQMCECPVIAFDYGAMRETVKHGETGFLVSSLEQMITYMNVLCEKSDHALSVMRGNCRDWALNFTVQKMIDRLEQLCVEAVEGGGW